VFAILIDEKPTFSSAYGTPEDAENPGTTVTAVDTVIRGQASGLGVRIDQAAFNRVGIGVTNSLLALEGVALDISRTINVRTSVSRQVRLVSRQSTFVTQDGFALLDFAGPAAPLFSLNRTSDNCVFVSSRNEAHIILQGPTSSGILGDMPWLLLKGTDNAYDQGISSIAACRDRNGSVTTTFGFNEATQESWFDERGTERRIPWVEEPTPSLNLSQATLADFAVQQDGFFSFGAEESPDFPNLQ
jgi:hypothetical protein